MVNDVSEYLECLCAEQSIVLLDSNEISNTHSMGIRIPSTNRGMNVVSESGMNAMVIKQH